MPINVTPMEDWGFPIDGPFLVAGPCSAESEEQLFSTAQALQGAPVSVFRAGIWKPRTHPGTFEGIGVDALPWLVRVKEELGMAVGVEIASPEHAEACLKYGIDLVWIGARTTPNPFAVQELADALAGSGMPVLVKNPVNPDLELWVGAIERLANAGLSKLGAIHRGFSTGRNAPYRNAPIWRIPIELKRRFPELPIVCDPSHICGEAKLIYSVAQEALDLLYDGLMVEVHIDPSVALSDAKQQITPDAFRELIRRFTLKQETIDNQEYQARMSELRHEIDLVDSHLLGLLSKRMQIVERMADCKRRNKISALQPHRWQEVLDNRVEYGESKGLPSGMVRQIYEVIHEEAIQRQERIFAEGGEKVAGR